MNKKQEINKFQLVTKRLILSELSINDLDELHALHSMPEVDEYNTLGIPKNRKDTRDFIDAILSNQPSGEKKHLCWSVRKKSSNDFIGIAGLVLSPERFRMAEIYFKLSPDFWEKGFATEIANRILEFGFLDLDLHRIEAGVAIENVRSIKVLKKLRFTREGLRRKILPIRGKWIDNYLYAIIKEDFILSNRVK